MSLTLGMISSQRQMGPYTLSYVGRANSSGAVSSLSGSFNLGTEYDDRLVFVGIMRTLGATASSSVTVGATSATRIGGSTTYGLTEWWYAASDTGVNSVSINANLGGSYSTCFVVYVLAGGAAGGTSPTIEIQSNGANNTNSTRSNFATALANDIFLALGIKYNGGGTSIGAFTSDMSPLTNNAISLSIGGSSSGSGSCSVGPVSADVTTYVQANGFDSSKSIQISTIRINKKT